MDKPRRVYYRIDNLPTEVKEELLESAETAGLAASTAASHIFSFFSRGSELPAAIIAGQLRLSEFEGLPAEHWGFHMDEPLKESLRDSAKSTGVLLGAVGRLVLIGLKGKIGTAIQNGLRSQMESSRP